MHPICLISPSRAVLRSIIAHLTFASAGLVAGCGGGGEPEASSLRATVVVASEVAAVSPAIAASSAPTEVEKLQQALQANETQSVYEPALSSSVVQQKVVLQSTAGSESLATQPGGIALIAPAGTPSSSTTVAAPSGRVFYVDSINGSDVNTGMANQGVGVGPWRSLARLQTAGLLPGDTVRLVCGSVWRETLKVPVSGTSLARVGVVAYPAGCTNQPVIDGGTVVEPASWVRQSGNIYRVTLSPDRLLGAPLLINGEFEAGLLGWSVWSPSKSSSLQQAANCPQGNCMRLSSGSDATLTLASSSNFALARGVTYFAGLSIKAAVGTRVRLTTKRAVAPFDSAGYDQVVTGTGEWQLLAGSFQATSDIAAVRLDIELLAANSSVLIDSVVLAPQAGTLADEIPGQLSSPAGVFKPAHHPNKGHNAAHPQSYYLRMASDADRVSVAGRTGSTYVPTGADLKLPAGAVIAPGAKVRIRSNAWVIEDGEVSSVSAGRINLAAATEYPLAADWGYFLMGSLWMVDSAGEWYYEAATSTIYAWMPDSTAPSVPVTISRLGTGIDVVGRSYVDIEGITVRNVGVGVNMRRSEGVRVLGGVVQDTFRVGIDAGASVAGVIDGNRIERTGADGISATESAGTPAEGLRVANNTLSQSGVLMDGDTLLSLPRRSFAAIRSGLNSVVSGNTVSDAGYLGIWAMAGGTVTENYVRGACSVQDDCGGVYTSGANNNGFILNNLVMRSRGALAGKPASAYYTQAQGIYVDELGSGVVVSGNTVIDADNGVQLHVAANNRIENNKLFGNRVSQIWIQETPKGPEGTTRTVSGNVVRGNQIVPTIMGTTGFLQSSDIGDTAVFSIFDQNRYFDRIHARVGSERQPGRSADFTLPQWKGALDTLGQRRNQDSNAFGASQTQYAAYLTRGANVVPNGNLTAGVAGWTTWNATAPYGNLVIEPCSIGTCARYSAGASSSLLSSPFFSATKGQWYRVTVDLATGIDGQLVQVVVRRGGGGTNGYESLNASLVKLNGTRALKRYSFVFAALQTVNANDPVTLDKGARIDFEKILPGQIVTVANLEMVPISSVDSSVRTDMLVNPSTSLVTMPCPVATSQPELCSKYVRFSDNQSVIWPYLLPARGAEVVYTIDRTLVDADADGVADSQDRCPGTTSGQPVNAIGCAIGQ